MQVDLRAHRKEVRRRRDAARGRLGRGRYDELVSGLASIMRQSFEDGETGSIFGLEGPLRRGIREKLCRQKWAWQNADVMAQQLLDSAFASLNAKRPDWDEGQPE